MSRYFLWAGLTVILGLPPILAAFHVNGSLCGLIGILMVIGCILMFVKS